MGFTRRCFISKSLDPFLGHDFCRDCDLLLPPALLALCP